MRFVHGLMLGGWLALAGTVAVGGDATSAPASWTTGPQWTAEQAELIALSDAWIAAEVGHDRAALERLLDERFLATRASGPTLDRAAYIDWILATEIEPFTVENLEVRLFGDTAVVISRSTSHRTKFTWIAVKRAGSWRVISETFTRVEAP